MAARRARAPAARRPAAGPRPRRCGTSRPRRAARRRPARARGRRGASCARRAGTAPRAPAPPAAPAAPAPRRRAAQRCRPRTLGPAPVTPHARGILPWDAFVAAGARARLVHDLLAAQVDVVVRQLAPPAARPDRVLRQHEAPIAAKARIILSNSHRNSLPVPARRAARARHVALYLLLQHTTMRGQERAAARSLAISRPPAASACRRVIA